MVFKRQPRLELPLVDDKSLDDDSKLTFFERFKRDTERNRKDGTTSKSLCVIMRSTMIFIGATEPFVLGNYIIPYMCEDCSPWTIYYMKVLVWFCIINMLANWFCLVLVDTSFVKTKDTPFINFDQTKDEFPDHFAARIEQASVMRSEQNGHCVLEADDEKILQWHTCDKCDMRVPPRSHHCKVCKKCILKRDHHCFMVGTCIGFKNQRYFIMMCFYVAICGVLGGALTLIYVKDNVIPELSSWIDIVLPITLVRCMFGYVKGMHCLLIIHMYIELFFGTYCGLYFNAQFAIQCDGKTPYEIEKKLPVRSTNSFNKNMKSVFGELWGLNFLFPMTIILRQQDDGSSWDDLKIDKNFNKIVNSCNGSSRQKEQTHYGTV
ncbi:hypothetical protein ACF0H5_002967 [Mactra antiquata]